MNRSKLPDPHILVTVPGAPRKAFQRLTKRHLTPSTPRQLRTTTVILEALEKAGLSNCEDDRWHLAISLEAANMAHCWFQLHGGRAIDRCGLLPTSLMKAVDRLGGEHHVTISNLHLPDPFAIHTHLFFRPLKNFPCNNSFPCDVYGAWRNGYHLLLETFRHEDCELFRQAGIRFDKTGEILGAEPFHARYERHLEEKRGETYIEIPELTPEIMAKMIANMKAHGLWEAA